MSELIKIVAAILTVRLIEESSPPMATHIDPARNIAVQTVTLYERILEELRERGHGGTAPDKTARELKVGSGTVQRVKRAMAKQG